MPKNKFGGNKAKKGKNAIESKDLVTKEGPEQVYATVTKMLGNCRVEAQCYDGSSRQCHIRGAMRKKVWIVVGDTILVSLRDFQDEKADVILKYNSDEVRKLKQMNEINEDEINIVGDGDDIEVEDCAFNFDDL
jgi:translation initiation factor 1A